VAFSEPSAPTAQAVLEVAGRAFRDRGYDVATLDEIAGELGISRPAVLHHFGSKQELLNVIVRPYLQDVDELLDRYEASLPLTSHRRRELVTELVDLIAEHRPVAALLNRDLTATPHLDPDLQVADRAGRFADLVIAAHDDDALALVRALSAIGAITRPMVAPDDVVDLDDPEVRRALVDAALAALRSGRKP
jgi:AcrR family transcriptional regulator